MDHELLIRVLRNLDGDQHQEDYFDSNCNYLELKYRQTVMVDRAVRKAKCKERYDLPANLRLFAIIIE